MIGHRGTIGVFAVLISTTVGSAAVIPSWRVNTISSGAITSSGGVLADARSVSLMVELTGGSLLSGGGLDLTFLPDLRFYQWRRFADDALDPPTPDDVSQFPNAAFDTLSRVNIIGPLNGPGPAQRANTDLQPASGDDRSGRLLNVAWGTGTGGTGLLEVMRFTAFGVLPGLGEISLSNGFVRDSLNPTGMTALPPLPFEIPEPGVFAAVTGTLAIILRRQRRGKLPK